MVTNRNDTWRARFGATTLAAALILGAFPTFFAGAPCKGAEKIAKESPQPDCTPIAGVEKLIGRGRIVLLGELHGTEESPAFTLAVACQAAAAGLDVTVGLELSGQEQGRVDAFLASAGGAKDREALLAGGIWQAEYQYGSTSRATVSLLEGLRRLKAAGLSVSVELFNRSASISAQSRDRLMADALAEVARAKKGGFLVALTGNIHSRVTQGTRWDPEFLPMGHLLAAQLAEGRELISLNVSHSGGTAWVCNGSGPDSCGAKEMGGSDERDAFEVVVGADTKATGHHGFYSVGPLTASPPAVASEG